LSILLTVIIIVSSIASILVVFHLSEIIDMNAPFVSKWDTRQMSIGSSGANEIRLPLEADGTYHFIVDWGDGFNDTIIGWDWRKIIHTYELEGIYYIHIYGTLIGWRFNYDGDRLKLLEISQWGALHLGNSGNYFLGCSNLNLTATDDLDLTGTTSLSGAFEECPNIGATGNMSGWDVSGVTDMSYMFCGASTFNQDISRWNVASVTNMFMMFCYATALNQSIGDWDVSNVQDMTFMFAGAMTFNQDIGNWDVSSVTDMDNMFCGATAFNQSIGDWDASSVTNMFGMFIEASAFNQDIGNWDVSNV
jgi:surface protein